MTMTKKPTEQEIADAREVLRKASASDDKPKQMMIDLVTMPEFAIVEKAMHEAAKENLTNVELGYCISMIDRLKAQFTPA
jgi:hypothetical protein